MAGRLYTVSFADVAVSVAQDLLNITSTSGMAFKLWRLEFGQRTLTTWEAKPVLVRRWSSTFSAGSGGTTPTPAKMNFTDAAATVTAHANDTTGIVVNTGAVATLFARDWEFLNGFIWVPMPDERPVIAPSQALSVNLSTAPSSSMTASGFAVIEELF